MMERTRTGPLHHHYLSIFFLPGVTLLRETKAIRPLVEGAFLGALVLVLTFFSLYVPLAALFITFIWPIPIIILGVRHGMGFSIKATVVVALLSAMLFHPFYFLVTLLGFGLVGIVIGGSLEEGFSPLKTYLLGTGASFFSQLLLLFVGMRMMGFRPLEELQYALEQALNLYSKLGLDPQIMGDMEKMMGEQLQMVVLLFPAIFLFSAAVTAGGTYLISLQVLRRLGYKKASPIPFKEWRMPKGLAALFIILFGVTLFGEYPLIQNLLMIVFILFFLQGLSVAYYLMYQYLKGRWPILLLLVLFILFAPLVVQALMITGIIDIWFDLRNLKKGQQDG